MAVKELYEKYGIKTTKDPSGWASFSGVGKSLQSDTWQEVRQLMKDAEKEITGIQTNERIVVEFPRHIVVLYPPELKKLLERDIELYEKALKRGKSELRYRANEKRAMYAKNRND